MISRNERVHRTADLLIRAQAGGAGPNRLASRPLSKEERALVIEGFNRTAATIPRRANVATLIHERARITPAAVAVVDTGRRPDGDEQLWYGGRRMTYRELSRRATLLATRLRGAGVGPGSVVAVCARRSTELLVGQLAVLTAGGAYLPLDPAASPRQLASAIADSGAVLLLAEPQVATQALLAGAVSFAATVLLTDTAHVDEAAFLGGVPAATTTVDGPPGGDPSQLAQLSDLAYLGYSHQQPEAPAMVEIEHRALLNLMMALGTELGGGPDDGWLSLARPTQGEALPELLYPLLVGARVVLADDATAGSGSALLSLVRRHRISHVCADADAWRRLLAAGFDEPNAVAIVYGPDVPLDLTGRVRDRVRRLSIMYGKPETTVWSTTYPVPVGPDRTSLGRPMANIRAYVLDERRRPVPVGACGELYLGGAGVARGYRNRPDLTDERFVADPYDSRGGRLFRTGDLVRWCTGGRLEHLGPVR